MSEEECDKTEESIFIYCPACGSDELDWINDLEEIECRCEYIHLYLAEFICLECGEKIIAIRDDDQWIKIMGCNQMMKKCDECNGNKFCLAGNLGKINDKYDLLVYVCSNCKRRFVAIVAQEE